jgi:hypothetical protein
MLAVRIYGLIWLFVIAAAALLYLIGFLSPIVVILFGKVVMGLVFIGIIGILPMWAVHQSSSKHGR